MACDPNTLLRNANALCAECNLTGDLYAALEIVLWCQLRDGTSGTCDLPTLIEQAKCIRRCIPAGSMGYVKLCLMSQAVVAAAAAAASLRITQGGDFVLTQGGDFRIVQ